MMCRQIAEDMAAECVAWDPARDIQFAEGLRMQYLGIVDKIKDFLDIPESLRLD